MFILYRTNGTVGEQTNLQPVHTCLGSNTKCKQAVKYADWKGCFKCTEQAPLMIVSPGLHGYFYDYITSRYKLHANTLHLSGFVYTRTNELFWTSASEVVLSCAEQINLQPIYTSVNGLLGSNP